MSEPTHDEEIQDKIALSEARTETKIARLEGKLETMQATLAGKLDAIGDKVSADHEFNRNSRLIQYGLFLALAGLLVAMATYGDTMFGRGMDVSSLIQNTIKETLAQQSQAAKK